MKKFRRILLLSLSVMAFAVGAQAAGDVTFSINDGVSSPELKSQMEKNVSALLTALNAAQRENRDIRYDAGVITPEAQQQIDMLWMNVHFFCEESDIVERCLTTSNGYQVRNIPLVLTPLAGEKIDEDYQEAVINFDKKGTIVSFFFTIGMNMYAKVMQNKSEISDIRRRMQILDYVEHFRTAYNMKDMPFLQQVFSDDALIITGRVVKVEKSELFPQGNKVLYKKQNKQQYLSNLANAFKAAKYIKVNFDDIKVVAHPTKANVYGVTLHQEWNTNRYSDEGIVFMIWDFTNEDQPKIHVRTWQPDWIDKDKGQRLNPNDVFTLSDFVL